MDIRATFLQQQFYFEHYMRDEGRISNLPLAFQITGRLSIDALNSAVNRLIENHEALRTYFTFRDGNLAQHILPAYTVTVNVRDMQEDQIDRVLDTVINKKFDIEAAPPAFYSVYRTDDTNAVFLAVFHHLLVDFLSLSVFSRQLGEIYNDLAAGSSSSITAPVSQFSDYARWEERFAGSPASEKMLDYWQNQFKGQKLDTLKLQKTMPPLSATWFKGNVETHVLSDTESARVSAFSAARNVNEFVILFSAYIMTLSHFSGRDNIITGVPLENRLDVPDKDTMGCLANMLPLSIDLSQADTVGELIQLVRRHLLLAHRNQKVSFNQIVKRVNPPRESGHNPLYQVAFTMRDPYPYSLELNGCETEFMELDTNSSLLDLYCFAGKNGNTISLRFEYNEAVYSKDFIRSFKDTYLTVLELVLSGPETALKPLDIMGQTEPAIAVSEPAPQQSSPGETTVSDHNFVLVSSFTCDMLVEPLRFWTEKMSVHARFDSVTNFQVYQNLLNPGSDFLKNKGGTSILLIRVEDWLKNQWPDSGQDDRENLETLNSETEKFISALQSAAEHASTQIILCLCHPSPEITGSPTRSAAITDIEKRIIDACDAIGAIQTISPADMEEYYTVENYHNDITLKQAQIPYNSSYFGLLSAMIARKLYLRLFPPYKVIAVDADNTLWRGAIGEDGIDAIVVDETYSRFQSFLVDLHSRGFLLCMVSKNEESDIIETFEKHPSMPLKSDHFVMKMVNWDRKSANLRQISRELDLGLDSFIFIDDNPMECMDVMTNCPEVLTIRMQDEPGFVERFTRHFWAASSGRISDEDSKRTQQYIQNINRKKSLQTKASYSEFIQDLDLHVTIQEANAQNFPRISQMTYRINQFRTKPGRLTEQQVKDIITSDTTDVYAIQASDRYGDYGTIGMMQLDRKDNELRVSQMLLSCRILGKGVEHRMVAFAGQQAIEKGLSQCTVEFVEMERNKPAHLFLEQIGKDFRQDKDGVILYRLSADAASHIQFNPSEYETGEPAQDDNIKPVPAANARLAEIRNNFVSEVFESLNSTSAINDALGSRSGASGERDAQKSEMSEKDVDFEREMVEIWKILLKRESINTSENFFDSGGHSILIPQIISKFHECTGYLLEILDIFTYPSIQSLMKKIRPENLTLTSSDTDHTDDSVNDRARKRAEKLSSKRKKHRGGVR